MPRPFPAELLALPHRRDVPFARLTSLGLGGTCRWLFEPGDEDEATRFVRTCHREGLAYRVLGGGSNLVVLGDVECVLRLRFPAEARRDGTALAVPASFGHIRLSETAAAAGLSGLEHAAGIPGTVGGALCMNAGAHGHDLSEVLERYRFLTPEGELVERRPEPGDFGYRASTLRHHGLALHLTLRLACGDPTRIRETMDAHRARRAATQPLATRNAGCIFKNPPGEHAGRLIAGAGLKGLRVGQAQVSPLHANFLVNLGGAGPQEFRELLDLVRERVREASGHVLELEVEVWGTAP